MKRDAYQFEKNWSSWKDKYFKKIKGVRREDHKILIDFLKDMELGINTPVGKKGKRGSGTLLNLASHNVFFLTNFKKPLLNITKKDLHKLEKDVNDGKILKRNEQKFSAFGNYIKDFKVLWNWLYRTKQVKENITEDISSKTEKPAWVYLNEEEIRNFFNKLLFYYRVIAWFMYDSGMRVTEANSIQIKHFNKDFTQVIIPEEASKTFGRTINLKLSSSLLKQYIQESKFTGEDFLFQKDLFATNKYLKENCGRMFGKDKVSNPKAKGKYGEFTLYDIRHNSSCFWLNRYPTHKGLMYRFGWKNSNKIEYYSEFLGQRDELTDEDMISGEDRNKLYKLEKDVQEIKRVITKLFPKVKKINEFFSGKIKH
ncbi:MAG: tyrosine-type recombinase/integrase [Nanoarchaeota archaeon]|nr:tyrosine-type recombinase/integrase [Nanoarchaeota archaeon]